MEGPLNRNWNQVGELVPRELVSDDEWEADEVTFVTLDMMNFYQSNLSSDLVAEPLRRSTNFQLSGIHGEAPLLRIGKQTFRGQWEELIGTEILLKQEDIDGSLLLGPVSKSSDRIRFVPVIVTTREETALRTQSQTTHSKNGEAAEGTKLQTGEDPTPKRHQRKQQSNQLKDKAKKKDVHAGVDTMQPGYEHEAVVDVLTPASEM
ncbi:hypothetical protein BT69DRAFT_1043858 [Atractiella rhizophila]|nr:hypothetical protein BT69DRAFT_1043858 [Atractiella rhizophila]